MEKISVTKPFTVLVGVIMVILLGIVSVTKMTLDLLPEMSLPYLMVITTYPGASPERVESDVIKLLESELGTISGVKNVTSTSSENYGMVQLEFEEDTNMDSAMVKVSSAVQEAAASLPEGCGTPSIMEISLDMMATMSISVSKDDADIYELSSFVQNEIQPYIERQEGVASVDTDGLVEKTVHIELVKEKIDALNDKLLATVSQKLAESGWELDKAMKEVQDGKSELEEAKAAFGETFAGEIFVPISETVLEETDKLIEALDELIYTAKMIEDDVDGDLGEAIDELVTELENISEQLENLEVPEVPSTSTPQIPPVGGGDNNPQIPNIPNFPNINMPDIELPDIQIPDNSTGITSQLEMLELLNSLKKVLNALDRISGYLEDYTGESDEYYDEDTVVFDGQSASGDLYEAIDGVEDALVDIYRVLDDMPEILENLETAMGGMTQAQLEAAVGFATATTQLSNAEAQLEAAKEQYEAARKEALANANLDSLIDVSTIAKLIYAQNFAMPAGYLDDENDETWLLKVGEEYGSVEDLQGALLTTIDGVGDIRLSDVATVTIIDNAGESYTRLNGKEAVILSIFKNSTTGTNATANNCLQAFDELMEKYPDCQIETLMNQGSYISVIVNSIASSMGVGAGLAIIVLAIFLKDFKPTLVVAFSIPLSVVIALLLMYFTGISLNMMSLSGLSLGIGMLVDNSVVVIENIYRLRGKGIGAPRASVQGTKQVAGSIISSTLTTVCVFMPLMFTEGMVRQLLMPMGLSIAYCLGASLLVAMTVVPASASTLLRKSKPKNHPIFDKIQDIYGVTLRWCLKHKFLPLCLTIGLLYYCVNALISMGIVLIPEMTADQIQATVTTKEGLTKEESYRQADKAIEAILKVDGVKAVGAMSGASSMFGIGGGEEGYGNYTFYIVPENGASATGVTQIVNDINEKTARLQAEVVASASGISDMTAMLGSGLTVNIYGNDLQVLQRLSDKVVKIVEKTDGYIDVSSSFADGEKALQLVINKDLAMSKGLTVAQIYMEIASKMTTSASSTNVTLNDVTMEVVVDNNADPLTVEGLLDLEFETTTMNSDGTTEKHKVLLSEFAELKETTSIATINRENQTRKVSVTAGVEEGYNATLLSRDLTNVLAEFEASSEVPDGYNIELGGESSAVEEMIVNMILMLALGCAFIYLIMVAQFQSLLSPFIVLFTVPLAFTGGMIGLMVCKQQLSLLSLMGFVVLMGTVVNNGIVFVDYANQLRIGGLERREALVATGKTRMRPILMTAITTILAMMQMIFSDDMAGQLSSGMAIVIVGGMIYATFMTLYIIPIVYDIMFKKPPLVVDIGDENIDDIPDDAAEYLEELKLKEQKALEAKQKLLKEEVKA